MSFSSLKGEYMGREALRQQFEEIKARENHLALSPKEKQAVPKRIQPITVTGQGLPDKDMRSSQTEYPQDMSQVEPWSPTGSSRIQEFFLDLPTRKR